MSFYNNARVQVDIRDNKYEVQLYPRKNNSIQFSDFKMCLTGYVKFKMTLFLLCNNRKYRTYFICRAKCFLWKRL